MATPFAEMLFTNAVPSDVDCERIRELLTAPQAEVAKVTEEIERLQILICDLHKRRDALNRVIDPLLALVSPVRRLPDDVVAEIFAASLPSDRNAVIDGTKSPLLLCHISQRWRNLALATPRLWTSLHIVAPSTPSKLGELSEAIDWWLSRTGVLPLSISVAQSFRALFHTDFSQLVQTLLPYSSRWNRIRFSLHKHSSLEPLKELSPADVPILETISIDYFSRQTASLPFLGTSSLRSASLRRSTGRIDLPWNQLRHLCLGEAAACESATGGLDLLRGCPNLETCALAFSGHDAPADDDAPTPTLCRLEHLRALSMLDNGVAGGTAQFFRHLELPQLEFLEYVTHSVEELPITPLLRSPHQLRRLSLNIQHLSSDALIECLRLVPDLHGLFIRHDPFDFRGSPPSRDGTLWAAFNPTTETLDDVLCPQLRSVKFTDFTGLSDDMILAFIRARTESRLAGIAHLTKFHAHLNRAVSVDIPAALRQAVADGLDLSLDYDDDRVQYSPSQENEMHAPRGEVQFDGWRSVW